MIYLASSWKNIYYPSVLSALREAGFEVYDFRNPDNDSNPDDKGFMWSKIDPNWLDWEPDRFMHEMDSNPLAIQQFNNDLHAIEECDACVLLLPCGRSAHTEAGFFAGRDIPVYVLIPEKQEAELMYGLFDGICSSVEQLISKLQTELPERVEIPQWEPHDKQPILDSDTAIRSVFGEDAPVAIIAQYLEYTAYDIGKLSSSTNPLNYRMMNYMLGAMVDCGLLHPKYCGMRRELTQMLTAVLGEEAGNNKHLLYYFCGRARPESSHAVRHIEEFTYLLKESLDYSNFRNENNISIVVHKNREKRID